MEEQEIQENNKLFTQFMDFPINHKQVMNDIRLYYNISKLNLSSKITIACEAQYEFDKSYDWLLPVLEKIETLGYKWEIGLAPKYKENKYHYCKIWTLGTVEGVSPIDAIYGAIITFIKYYNYQNF